MTQIATAELSLTLDQLLPAPPARVYDAWLDPGFLARFMSPCAGGSVPEASVDARVGGAYRIVMNDGSRDIPHHGTYLEMQRPHRLRFTWQSPHSVEGSVVTLTLTPEGEGTRLVLRQDRFAHESARDGHIKGWTFILNQLVQAL